MAFTADNRWPERYNALDATPHLKRAYLQQKQQRLSDSTLIINTEAGFNSLVGSSHLLTCLVPGPDKLVKVVHNLHILGSDSYVPGDEKVIGLYGNRSTARFQVLPVPDMVELLYVTGSNVRFRIPSLRAILDVKTEEEFSQLGHSRSASEMQVKNSKRFFLVDPHVAFITSFTQTAKASRLGFLLIQKLRQIAAVDSTATEDDDNDAVIVVAPSPTQLAHETLLTWLWIIATQDVPDLPLTAPTESSRLDDKIAETDKLFFGTQTGPAAVAPTGAGGDPHFTQVTTKLFEHILKGEQLKQNEKTLFFGLQDDAKKLWNMMGAETWDEVDPEPFGFAKKFLSSTKASTQKMLMDTEVSNTCNRGELTRNAFIEMFTNGHLSPDPVDPGGLSPFYCKPSSHVATKDRKKIMTQILRDGDGQDMDATLINSLATAEIYVATNLDHLLIQMETFVNCFLPMFVNPQGMIVLDSQQILLQLDEHRAAIQNCFSNDKTFGARYAYRIDRIYYRFFKNLLAYDEIREASTFDRDFLLSSIQAISNDLALGNNLSSVALPPGVLVEIANSAPKRPRDQTPTRPTPSSAKPAKRPATSLATNPNPMSDWLLPKGKFYGDFFQGGVQNNNNKNWPKFPHHSSGKVAPLCIKYQAMGSCSNDPCQLAHVSPSAMSDAEKQSVTDRFQKSYA
jgi:hypothetical protein